MVLPFVQNMSAREQDELRCLYFDLQMEYRSREFRSQVSLVSDQPPLFERTLLRMGYVPLEVAPVSLDIESSRNVEEPLQKAAIGSPGAFLLKSQLVARCFVQRAREETRPFWV